MKKIIIKYFEGAEPIEKISKGDWIDLRSNADFEYKAGDFILVPLGVAMQLPKGYEANAVPRSSTFKHYGIIQTNSFGVIDESYAGNSDEWFFPAYALRDGKISRGDRICQFRINKKMKKIKFKLVEVLFGLNRGGHGSTGK